MKRDVTDQAFLDAAIEESRSAGSPTPRLVPVAVPITRSGDASECPVCLVVHREAHMCPKFWQAWAERNEHLRAELRSIPTPFPPRSPECRKAHPIDAVCPNCESDRKLKIVSILSRRGAA